jgi:hypothetical protein
MVRRLLTAFAALALAAPGLAAPSVTANVSHNCCPQCDRAIVRIGTKVAWVGEFKTDRSNLSVSAKPQAGARVDLMPLLSAFQQGGFPLQTIKLEGVKVIEFNAGHLCCNGCVGPLRAALGNLKSLTNLQMRPNTPVRATVNGGTLDVTEFLKVLDQAGYSAISLVVVQ